MSRTKGKHGMRFKWLAVALGLALTWGVSDADLRFAGWGPRAGLRFGGPDQFVVGAHANLGEITENLRFQPMIDLGFGDDLTVYTFNADAVYFFRNVDTGEENTLYAGGGLAVVHSRLDIDCPAEAACSGSETDIGINFIGGIERSLGGQDAVFGELRFTIGDGSFGQFTIGYSFGS